MVSALHLGICRELRLIGVVAILQDWKCWILPVGNTSFMIQLCGM